MRVIGFGVGREIVGGLGRALHQGNQRLALERGRQRQTQHAEKRGRDVDQAYTSRNATSGKEFAREFEDERNANGFVVEKDSVHRLAMSAERLAVIRHHHDDGVFIEAALAEVGEELAEGGVGVGDLAIIGVGEPLVVRCGRIVGRVWVVKMYPQEEWGLAILGEPGGSVRDNLSATAFDRDVSVFAGMSLGTEAGIEEIEAAIEARSHAGVGIEDERSDECGSVITALLQNFRKIGKQRGERMAEIGDGVKLRIGSGENCRV